MGHIGDRICVAGEIGLIVMRNIPGTNEVNRKCPWTVVSDLKEGGG